MKRLIQGGLAALLALVLTCLSVRFERVGPAQVVYGNLCGPQGNDYCYQPELSGGFPLAYLSDQPGVSVERKLHWGEDTFRPWAFVADGVFYFSVLLVALRLRPGR